MGSRRSPGRGRGRRSRGRGSTGRSGPLADLAGEAVDEAIGDSLRAAPHTDRRQLVDQVRTGAPLLSVDEVEARVDAMVDRRGGMAPIAALLADDSITEVMINGPGRVWIERDGLVEPGPTTIDGQQIELLIERITAPLGLRVDRTAPIVDARLADGSRVNIVVPPLAIGGPAVSIRRFTARPVPLSSFGPPTATRLLTDLMAQRASILVVGPTSSGKTTLINSLATLVDRSERIICIEDTAELQLRAGNVVRLEARPANSEGIGEVTLRRLVLTALRMRPDRLVVGEVRGAEAFDLLLALTSGHRGCLTSCHAADAAAGLRRLEVLAGLADPSLGPDLRRHLVGDGLDAVVVTAKVGARRLVVGIAVVEGDRLLTRWSAGRARRRGAA